MANNISVKDSSGNVVTMKTTDVGTVHTPHYNVDSLPEVTQGVHDSLAANVTIQVGDVDVGNANPVPVSDAGGSLTVDGTVTANLSATDNAVLDDVAAKLATIDADTSALFGAVAGTEMQVDVVAALPAGANLIGKVGIDQATANANEVVVKSITAGDNNIGNVDVVTVPAPLNVVGTGTEATALRVTLASDSTGVVSVDDNGSSLTVDGAVAATQSGAWNITTVTNVVHVDDNASTLTVDGTVTANLSATDNAVLDDIAAKLATIDADTSGLFGTVGGTELQVDVVASLPAGTNAIGKLAANSGVDIGDVDVISMPTGASATAVQGTVAHDSAAAQNPVQIAGEARATERAAVASADVARFVTDLTGKLINLPYANPENFVKGATAAITDTTRTAVIAAQGEGVKIYVTQLLVTNGDADTSTAVTIESATTAIYRGWAQAAGGGFSISFPVPIATAANEALNATCGTTGATVYVSASGYKGI